MLRVACYLQQFIYVVKIVDMRGLRVSYIVIKV